jgi:hypothetical protein
MKIAANVTTETLIPGLKRHLINFCCVRSIVAATLGLSRVQNGAKACGIAASRTSPEQRRRRARHAVSSAQGSPGLEHGYRGYGAALLCCNCINVICNFCATGSAALTDAINAGGSSAQCLGVGLLSRSSTRCSKRATSTSCTTSAGRSPRPGPLPTLQLSVSP